MNKTLRRRRRKFDFPFVSSTNKYGFCLRAVGDVVVVVSLLPRTFGFLQKNKGGWCSEEMRKLNDFERCIPGSADLLKNIHSERE